MSNLSKTLWVLPSVVMLCASVVLANNSVTVTRNIASMPLAFTENQGQWDEQVQFRVNAGGATMWFTSDGAYYQFTRSVPGSNSVIASESATADERGNLMGNSGRQTPSSAPNASGRHDVTLSGVEGRHHEPDSIESIAIKASFIGANPNPQMIGIDAMEYKCNYFIGNDPNEWHTDVPNYNAIIYEEIYSGIDLKYYGNGKQMEYDFIVSPGADYSQIQIQYDGAESVSINNDGELVVETIWGDVVEQRPVVYQIDNSTRIVVAGEYSLKGDDSFGFQLSSYDPALPLVIDPVLSYSTYLGGSSSDYGNGIAVNNAGCAYVMGHTWSSNFPTQNAYDASFNGGTYDVFVTKFTAPGNALVYSTFLGGSDWDLGYGIAVDGSGCAFVTGRTYSSDFPTQNAFDLSFNGIFDVFVTEISAAGNELVFSTFLGGWSEDWVDDIAVDGSGCAYVTGSTHSSDFPTQNAYDASFNGGNWDAFVSKFTAAGNELVFSTFLGGSSDDLGYGIVVDGSGCAYVTGSTASSDFPTQNAYDASLTGSYDVFVTKFTVAGGALTYSTFLGGSDWDYIWGITVDGSGCAYVTGYTKSTDFPMQNAYDASFNGGTYDVFVTKFTAPGNALVYSTFLGGSDWDLGYGIAVDGSGCAYVTGYTYSSDFPAQNAYDASFNGESDVSVTKFTAAGNELVFSTFLGGSGGDGGASIAVDGSGCVYVTGTTSSPDFPTLNAYDVSLDGSQDVFVAKLSDVVVNQPPTASIDNISPNPAEQGQTVLFEGSSSDLDGTVVDWWWESDIDNRFGYAEDFSYSGLSVGTHTITFKVLDNDGAWSPEVSAPLEVQAGSSDCLTINPQLTICADIIVEDPTDLYTVSGNVVLNDILRLGGTVVVDMRDHLYFPEIQGSGAIVAQDIEGADYTLYAGGGSYTLYCEDNHLKAHDAAGLLRGDFNLMGFDVDLGDFAVDPDGQYLETRYTIDLVYPLDKVMERLSTEHPGDFPGYFDEASFGRTYSRAEGVTTHGDIGPLGVNLKLWALYDVTLYWNESEEVFGGSFKVKIPGADNTKTLGGQGLSDGPDWQERNVPVEIRDTTGMVIGSTDYNSLLELARSGAFLDGFGVAIEFMQGGINKLIVTLTGSIPLGTTGLRITEMNGGIIDAQTNLKVVVSVDIETLIPDLPIIGPPIKVDDLGITARPSSYLRGEGTLQVCSYDLSSAWVEYDGQSGNNFLAAEGYLNLADLFVGNISMSISGNGYSGHGDMTMKTPSDLPWGFGWAENQVISAVRTDIHNSDFRGQGQIWILSLAQRVLFGNPSFPWFHYYLGTNYDDLVQIWKGTKGGRQEIEFQVPENCPQMFVTSGNDSYLFHFSLVGPSLQTFDSTFANYRQFQSSLQTVMIVEQPEPGLWTYQTDEVGEIQMEALGRNLPPVMEIELPTVKRSRSSNISLNFNDYSDTIDVEVYWDLDWQGFDGQLIAGFAVENTGTVNFDWNTFSLPDGEYFIYCRIDDGSNAPLYQYAPGSIWVTNHSEIETPQNLSVTSEGDSVKISWDAPISTDLGGAMVFARDVSNDGTTSYAFVDSGDVFIHDLIMGNTYGFRACYVDLNQNLGQRSAEILLDYIDETENNPPYFTLDVDSTWYFIVGEPKQYDLSANDLDSDPISFVGVGLPPGAAVTGSQCEWTPDSDSLAGYHAFSLVATDNLGGADTVRWGALVYKAEQIDIAVRFSSPNLYDGDNMYVIVSNIFDLDSAVQVSVENLRSAEQTLVTCTRVDQFEYIGNLSLSAARASDLTVEHGDTLEATYFYDGSPYLSRTCFDTTAQPRDITPPRTVTDLQYEWLSSDSVLLYWIAPGDDSAWGRALYYDLRYDYAPILGEEEYLTAFRYSDVIYPGLPGKVDSTIIRIGQLEALGDNEVVYIALKSEDDAMNRSGISNVLSVSVPCCIHRGDVNHSGDPGTDISDLVYLVDYMFNGGAAPLCEGEADIDGSGGESPIDISDLVYLVDYMFNGGPPPPVCP